LEALAHETILDVNLAIFCSVASGVESEEGGRCQLDMHSFSLAENFILSRPARKGATFLGRGGGGTHFDLKVDIRMVGQGMTKSASE
jgi:hypothetical protein